MVISIFEILAFYVKRKKLENIQEEENAVDDSYIYRLHWSWPAGLHVWNCMAGNLSGMGTAVFFWEFYRIHNLLRNDVFQSFERKSNQPFRNKVSAFSTALTAAAMAGFSISGNYYMLCLFAVPLGVGAGAIDTALNNYVAVHYTSRHMSFLYCFYGIGVVASPYVLATAMHGDGGWRNGYRIVFLIHAGIAVILFLMLPLWKKYVETGKKRK